MHDSPQILHHAPASPLRLLSVGIFSHPHHRDFKLNLHWQFAYYRSGNIECAIGDETFETEPGMLLVIPPRTRYSERAEGPYEKVLLALEAPPPARWSRVFFDTPELEIGWIFQGLLREYDDSQLQRSEMVGLLLLQLELLLRRQAGGDGLSASQRAVQRAEKFVERNLASQPGLPEIARAAGVAPSTLRGYFKEHRGHAPGEYVRRVRVRYTLSLLLYSELTLEAIAELSGYDSASHLSRHVKRATAMSPGAYRATRPRR